MFFRKYEEIMGIHYPQQWRDKVSETFNAYFSEESIIKEHVFQSFGFHHIDETVIIISLVPFSEITSPVSLFISKDLSENEKKSERDFNKAKDNILDIAGIILKELIKDFDNLEYILNWTEYEFRKEKYFYKITRENIDLSIKTEEILSE